jgi:calpain-7
MRAIKLATDPDQKSDLRTRCQSLLNEAERIKLLDEWHSTTSLSVALPVTSIPDLLEFSETTSIYPSHSPPNPSDLLSSLDSITISNTRARGAPSSATTRIKRLVEPVSTRIVTTTEQILLLRGSKLNGFTFPPWKGPPGDEEFAIKDGDQPFL